MMNNLLRRFGLRRDACSDSQTKSFDEDFFTFRQLGTCGFPNKPSCLALDEDLGLVAVGTKTGFIHIFGQPGVHLEGQHESQSSVIHVSFLKGKSKFVTVCCDGSFVVWSLKTTTTTSQESPIHETCDDVDDECENLLVRGKHKKLKEISEDVVSFCCLNERVVHEAADDKLEGSENKDGVVQVRLLVGLTNGNVFSLGVTEEFVDVNEVDERSVGGMVLSHDDVIVEHFSEEEVKHLGSVVSIELHPTMSHKVLVGYSIGFAVMWNLESMRSECVFSSYQQLENLAFNHDGSEFVSSHSDGSYIIWNTIDSTEPREPASTPYGPYQCEAINKFVWKTNESSSMMIFSGGMPRSGYGDRWTVTVMRGDGDDGEQSHVVLDLTSRVIDFVIVDSIDTFDDGMKEAPLNGPMEDQPPVHVSTPHSLVVLTEEEMVVIDLVGRDWPTYRLPHLTSPHCSAITSVFHVSEAADAFMKKIVDAGKLQQMKNVTFTRKTWPFLGGQTMFSKDREKDLLLTGHEDGSVRFWQTKRGDIELLYRLDTAHLFGIELSNNSEVNNDSDEDWPPFKKVGAYNPFTDDPRLAIRQMILSTSQEPETLVLSGTAGQIIVCEFNSEQDRRIQRKSSCREVLEEESTEVGGAGEETGTSSAIVHRPLSEASVTSLPPPSSAGQTTEEDVGGVTPIFSPSGTSTETSVGHLPGSSRSDKIEMSRGYDSLNSRQSRSSILDSGTLQSTRPRPSRIEVESETVCSGSFARSHPIKNRESYSSSMSSGSSLQYEIKVSSVNLVGDRDDFIWMGHTPLEVVNFNDKNRTRGVKSTTSPSSVFMPCPSTSCSAYGEAGPGFQASCVVVVHPPVSCTSLAVQSAWQLIGFGSEYGYGLYDYNLGKVVFSRGSKSKHGSEGGEAVGSLFGLNSRFSDAFRRTLRASFRRLERARSEFKERRRSQQSIWKSFSMSRSMACHMTTEPSSSCCTDPLVTKDSTPPKEVACPDKSTTNKSQPHKRNNPHHTDLFKGNSLDRDPQSASLSRAGTPIVRCLYFGNDVLPVQAGSSTGRVHSNNIPEFGTFWVGTSLGTIYMYNITISPPGRRNLQPVVYSFAKEIHLKHEAPILDICILDKSGSPIQSGQCPVPVVNRNKRWKFPSSIFGSLMSSNSSDQCLVVCSQKQVKLFSYPGLKAKRKVKVDKASTGVGATGVGATSPNGEQWVDQHHHHHHLIPNRNITKVAYSSFEKKTDESVVESGLVCLTDDGGANVYSMPSLKLRFSTNAVSKEFMSDMKLCVLTSRGYGFYLCSPSEFGKFSVSTICPRIRSLSLLPTHAMVNESQKKKSTDGLKRAEEENPKRTPNSGSIVTSADAVSLSIANQPGIPLASECIRDIQGRRSRSQSPQVKGSQSSEMRADMIESSSTNEFAMNRVMAEPIRDEIAFNSSSLERPGGHILKVADISIIKEEQMIEKIISKFAQMEVPMSRREIQFSKPLQQQRSRGQSPPYQHGVPGDQLEKEEELCKPSISQSNFAEEVGMDGRE